MAELPEPADALPAAEHHCLRATAHLEGRPGARGTLLGALAGLLEAAGGPDVGNAVRAHLERSGGQPPERLAADRSRTRVLLAARRLHLAAEADVRAALQEVGLGDVDPSSAEEAAEEAGEARLARRRHVGQVLAARRDAVDRVLRALAGHELPGQPGPWRDALGADLPHDDQRPGVSG